MEANEELDMIAAVEIMDWTPDVDEDGMFWGWTGEDCSYWGTKHHNWRPTADRNQSRQVVEAAMGRLGAKNAFDRCVNAGLISEQLPAAGYENKIVAGVAWCYITPRQEVEAAILAVREFVAMSNAMQNPPAAVTDSDA